MMMVGKPFTFGIIMLGITGSIAPNETPFVAYVTIPKITSMLAMVEINGCILNFAVKNPAILVNTVHKTIHTTNAKTTLPPTGIFVKSKVCPNTVPVFIP